MNRILVVVGHPYFDKSFANRAILEEFAKLCPEAEISNLFELYPDGKIDVAAEQAKLLAADTVVLQFPIMWYGCPSLMHKWMEEVLAYGFAYGAGGDKVLGKRMIASFTGAGTADMYSRFGAHGTTIDSLMPPFTSLARYCGLDWIGYTFSGGMHLPYDADGMIRECLLTRAHLHARRLLGQINRI